MANKHYTKLTQGTTTFNDMMKNGFGVVTVMNAAVYEAVEGTTTKTPYDILKAAKEADVLCTLDTLKIANITIDGPAKTISGGQYGNPLIKFGKTARLEMQDALGTAQALDVLGGGIREWNGEAEDDKGEKTVGLHFGEDFGAPVTIIGDSFFIDRKTGQQVKVKIIFYKFLPDSIFNLTQDAEGDATVFDMNGDLLTTEVLLGDKDGLSSTKTKVLLEDTDGSSTKTGGIVHGVFYSIVDPEGSTLEA